MEKYKINKWFYLICALIVVCFATLLIVFSVNGGALDLSFSKAVATVKIGSGSRYSNNLFANIFEVIGHLSSYFIWVVIMLNAEYILRRKKMFKPNVNLFFRILTITLAIALAIYLFHDLFKTAYRVQNNCDDNVWTKLFSLSLLVTIPLGLLLAVLVYYFINKSMFDPDSLIRFTIMCGIGVAISLLTIHGLKSILPRYRYRALVYLDGNYTSFSPWYQKSLIASYANSIKDDFKSFPSGHTQAVASLFIFSLLPYYFEKYNTKWRRLACFIVPPVIALTVMFSRIVAGAHYVTDVSFSFLLTFVCIFIAFNLEYYLFKRKASLNA